MKTRVWGVTKTSTVWNEDKKEEGNNGWIETQNKEGSKREDLHYLLLLLVHVNGKRR